MIKDYKCIRFDEPELRARDVHTFFTVFSRGGHLFELTLSVQSGLFTELQRIDLLQQNSLRLQLSSFNSSVQFYLEFLGKDGFVSWRQRLQAAITAELGARKVTFPASKNN